MLYETNLDACTSASPTWWLAAFAVLLRRYSGLLILSFV